MDKHECEMTSICCGGGSHPYVDSMCGVCKEWSEFECIECEG